MNNIASPGVSALRQWMLLSLRRWSTMSMLVLAATACGGVAYEEGEGTMLSAAAPIAKIEKESRSPGLSRPDARLAHIREVQLNRRASLEITEVRLGPLSEAEEQTKATEAGPGPLRIGTVREIQATAEVSDLAALLRWQIDATTGRSIASMRFESAEARGVRLAMLVSQMPPRTVLRVYASNGSHAIEIDSAEILRTIAANRAAGVIDKEAHLYWLPTTKGASTTLEIELSNDADPSSIQIAVPEIGHLWALPDDDAGFLGQKINEPELLACHFDVTCNPDWDAESRGVAKMMIRYSGGFGLCTGTLVNDRGSTGTPYFLTAYHCLSTQTQASALETVWFYRSAACGSNNLSAESQTIRGGATLLYANQKFDTAFMRLNGDPPAGAYYLGSSAALPSATSGVMGIHHPDGALQKISRGQISGYAECSTPDVQGRYRCSTVSADRADHLTVNWLQGLTEPGSSGSPLFAAINGQRYVVGVLHGSTVGTSCESAVRQSQYGRFDLAYQTGIARWLNEPSAPPQQPLTLAPVYRFYNIATGTHFYTTNAMERDYVVANFPSYIPEGTAFYAATQPAPGGALAPVYRFYNEWSRTHFFTSSEGERDYVLATYPSFHYEGIAWYAAPGPYRGSSPMYRFYNTERNSHFYTIDPGEFVFVRNNYPSFLYEGVAYHAWK